MSKQRLGDRDRAAPLPLGRVHGRAAAEQVFNDQVVADTVGMLEIADRIDADGVRDLPRGFRQLFDGGQRVGRKGVAIGGLQDEKEVVVLGIGRLQILERHQLRVLVREKHAIVVRELEETPAGSDRHGANEGGDDDHPAKTDDESRQVLCESVDALE